MDLDKINEVMKSLDIRIFETSPFQRIKEFNPKTGRFDSKEFPFAKDKFRVEKIDMIKFEDDGEDYTIEEFETENPLCIKAFIKMLKKRTLSEEEVKYCFKLLGVSLDEKILLEVYDAPLEEYLSHSNSEIRKMGLSKRETD